MIRSAGFLALPGLPVPAWAGDCCVGVVLGSERLGSDACKDVDSGLAYGSR